MGWKIEHHFPQHLKKYIIIVAPHTSWIDFPVCVFVKYITQIDVKYFGKASLFKSPLGFMFRALGGIPVDRSKSKSRVEAMIELFKSHDHLIFALSPEGTRKKVNKWKTGFYHVALGANVPIVMAALDFENKTVKLSEPYNLLGDKYEDFVYFQQFFKSVNGKIKNQFDPNFHLNL